MASPQDRSRASPDTSHGLLWRRRYQIMNGICDSSNYLQPKKIVHSDLKPTNVLLDYNVMPKIADYSLSRCFDENQTLAITLNLIGTMGYLAPEFYTHVQIPFKSDIYSLGVIIMEILTGEKGYMYFSNGTYGKVYKGVHNGEEIAVKKLYNIQEIDFLFSRMRILF